MSLQSFPPILETNESFSSSTSTQMSLIRFVICTCTFAILFPVDWLSASAEFHVCDLQYVHILLGRPCGLYTLFRLICIARYILKSKYWRSRDEG